MTTETHNLRQYGILGLRQHRTLRLSWGSGMSRFTAHIGDFGNTGGWGSLTEHAASLTGDRDCGCSGSEFPQKSQSTVTISGDSLWDGVLMNTKFNLWRGHLGSTVNSFCVRYQLRNGKHWQKHPKYFTVDCFRDCCGRLYYWVSEKHQKNIIICSRNRKLSLVIGQLTNTEHIFILTD